MVIGEEAAGAGDLRQEWGRREAVRTREDNGTLTRQEKKRENQITLLSPHMGTSYSPEHNKG